MEKNTKFLFFFFSFLQGNGTFAGIGQFKIFINSINTIITKLRTDDVFKERLTSLLDLAKTPFIQSIISSAHIDFKMIESVLNGLMYDDVSFAELYPYFNITFDQ